MQMAEELEENEICVKIPGKANFYCENTWTVGEAQNKIRDIYNLTGGEIKYKRKSLKNHLSFAEQLKNGVQNLFFVIDALDETTLVNSKIPSFQTQNLNLTLLSLDARNYARLKFTKSPAFGDEFIIGNLNEIVQKIETHILNGMNSNENIKENYPFHCIINPPRHGKSLLLDCLFRNNETVIVIGITYNSTTGLVKGELDSPMNAIKWFWTRVLKSMLQINQDLKLLHSLLEDHQYSWFSVKHFIIQKLSSNLFVDKNGDEKNILFCIDEFSVLTDKILGWTDDQQKEFIYELHGIKRASKPFIQFVLTGFHQDMYQLLSSSSSIRPYNLALCDFSNSRPLLKKILEIYELTKGSDDQILFPLFLFEIVKSTPGLIGFWAELLNDKILCHKIDDFASYMPWVSILTQKLEYNWLIIFNYLLNLTEENPDYSNIGELIVEAEIGICYPNPEIIPLCFVIITKQAHVKKIGKGIIQTTILKKLADLYNTFQNINPYNKVGKPFEQLTATALHIRLLLWYYIKFNDSNYDSDRFIQIPFHSFLLILSSDSYSGIHNRFGTNFLVHLIRAKESLRTLLLQPLYNIFPLGLKSLTEDWDISPQTSSLKELIKSKKSDYQLTPITYEDTMIDVSSKYSQIQQTIICKIDSWIMNEDVAVELFFRMKDGETYEAIHNRIDENVQIWWNQLKMLVDQLKRLIDNNHSLISTSKDAEGADLLIIWKVNQEIHIAALELKDQRQTNLGKWKGKWDSLMSPLCILHWIPLFYSDYRFSIHAIFAGREHSSLGITNDSQIFE